jgi:hypothetical protein
LEWILVFGFYAIVVVLIGSNDRAYMQQKYKIPAKLPFCCAQFTNDLFFMLFLWVLFYNPLGLSYSLWQRHRGQGCTTTGLGPDAPEIV